MFILVSAILEKMRKERAAARQNTVSLRPVVDNDRMEVDSPTATPPSGSALPSTDPFEFPASPGTSDSDLAVQTSSFSSFDRASSTTPSSLIPQTASLSLAPDSRPSLSPSPSQQDSPNFKSTAQPIDKLPIGLGDRGPRSLDSADPIFAGVASMRQQRMSMVANYRQYVCVHECVLVGALQEISEELKEMRSVIPAL